MEIKHIVPSTTKRKKRMFLLKKSETFLSTGKRQGQNSQKGIFRPVEYRFLPTKIDVLDVVLLFGNRRKKYKDNKQYSAQILPKKLYGMGH